MMKFVVDDGNVVLVIMGVERENIVEGQHGELQRRY